MIGDFDLQPPSTMKLKSLAFVLAFAAPMLASADGQQATTRPSDKGRPAKLTEDELEVLAHVHHVNQLEIDMGKLATKRGTPAVKRYGETLVRDHSASDKDVIALAKRHAIAKIPAEKPATEADKAAHQEAMEAMARLKKLSGADFDREYLRLMVEGHDAELASSDPMIASATVPELKRLLEDRKTRLARHADAARELQQGNAQTSASPKAAPTTVRAK